MDPLSLCTSALKLIGVSKTVTQALYSFTRYASHAEAHVASLCSETTALTEFLSSINKTLKSCRRNPRALALVDAELWRQSDLALQDCRATLNELSSFVAKLKSSDKTPFWRAKVAYDMGIHAGKLEQFRDRVKRSNFALQTVLQTITVSVSLQNNASQDRVLLELDKLKVYINDALWIASRSPVGTQTSLAALSETISTKNLHGLVRAAGSFYSSATTTVESSLGGSIAVWSPPARDTANSIAGLSPFRAERLYEYIQNTRQESNPFTATIAEARDFHPIEFPEHFVTDESAELTETPATPEDPTLDVDFQLPLVEVLEDFAIEKMKNRDFESAAAFLNQALTGEMGPVSEMKTQIRLQIRLGICYVLQRKIPEARKVISKLEKMGGLENIEVLYLMHALAMVYFAQYDFTEAKDLCTRVINAKTRLLGKSHPEYLTSLGFLGYLYDQFDWPIQLEAIRRLMPHGYVYSHPESEFDFLAQHSKLMPAMALQSVQAELPCTSFSEDTQIASSQTTTNECATNHSLKRALTRYESKQTDTMKVFVSMTVIQPPEEDDPAPETSYLRDGQKRFISRSMTSLRRHFTTWQSSTERKERASTGNSDIQRSRTVLPKARPGSQRVSAGSTGLARAKKLLSMLKTETPMITAVTEETFSMAAEPTWESSLVFELDSKCITREDPATRLAGSDEEQEIVADHGPLQLMRDIPPSQIPRGSAKPLFMSLDSIPELPELDSGDSCGLDKRAPIVIDSDNSSDGSISRGSSASDNRSTGSGSSRTTDSKFSEAFLASSGDSRDNDSSIELRSMSQQHEVAQLAKNGPAPSMNRSKASKPSYRMKAKVPSFASFISGVQQLTSLLAAHRFAHCANEPHGSEGLPNALPEAIDTGPGVDNDECGSQSPDQNTQLLPNVPNGGERDDSGQTRSLARAFSWSHGDENLFLVKMRNQET